MKKQTTLAVIVEMRKKTNELKFNSCSKMVDTYVESLCRNYLFNCVFTRNPIFTYENTFSR